LVEAGIELNYMRVRALPLSPEVATFVQRHDQVYVVEQNRDGQLYGILRTELPTHLIGRLESIRHYNGVPIDARAIIDPLIQQSRHAVSAE
jgi:2-oxoglutarate ferredoxin oxidoreductase subunit alpha